MKLRSGKRVSKEQKKLRKILKAVRCDGGDELTKDEISYLCDLNLKKHNRDRMQRFTPEEIKRIEDKALYLFANIAPRDTKNLEMLKGVNSASNPVARVKARTTKAGRLVSNTNHYDKRTYPDCVLLARETRVSITGKNICPEWGLFNGSLGTVKDIVYSLGEHPKHGDMPQYVLVEFDQYCGPVFTNENPKIVPIVPISVHCDKGIGCCEKLYIPLRIAWAKTIHTFQGATVGPEQKGQVPNAVQRIICDVGTKAFEGHNVGLFYTILSRVTSLGTIDDKASSAIYFIGDNLNPGRITDLLLTDKRKLYKKAEKRIHWVTYLDANSHDGGMSGKEQKAVFKWANKQRVSGEKLLRIIERRR